MGERIIKELRTGHVRPVLPVGGQRPALMAEWNGFRLEKRQHGEHTAKDVCFLNHMIFLQIDLPAPLEWTSRNYCQRIQLQPGRVSFIPAYYTHSLSSARLGNFLMLGLEERFLTSTAARLGVLDHVELPVIFDHEDTLMREIIVSLEGEASRSDGRYSFYPESLATMAVAHLIRNYALCNPPRSAKSRGLTRQQLGRAIDLIHRNLAEGLSLGNLAQAAGLSPYHFARLFKISTGLTPHQYVTRCRVQRAKELLLRQFSSLTDVALQVGFCDQSHLTRHFKQIIGQTPAAFVRHASFRKNLH